MLTGRRLPPLVDAVQVHLVRFVLMLLVVLGASLIGVHSWFVGLAANVVVTVYALVLMSARGLWRSTGVLRLRAPVWAVLALLPFLAEALSWWVGGIDVPGPGLGWWCVTLLLVGVNEELISRGVVLSRLASAYRPAAAVGLTAVLFGLQHLSALALTSRGVLDVLLNVLASGTFGFALAAYQARFMWLLPLILVHALADLSTITSRSPWSDGTVALMHVGFLGLGLWFLRGVPDRRTSSSGSGDSRRRLSRDATTGHSAR